MDQGFVGAVSPEPDDSAGGITVRRNSVTRNKVKVLVVMLVAVTIGALGDVSLARGMKTVGAVDHPTLLHAIIFAITNPYVITGVLLMLVFLILYLASLSWEDLSFVLPLTAADYVLVTVFAHFLLHEDVSVLRWAGSVCVAIGISLVART